jgi:alpha-1,3-rhamnosyl/mannosyltransferase
VRVLGYVPEAELPSLTAAATAFAYPSHYEGFGFPLAQAMAAGVPVVTSNVSSMPEVAGDAGLLIEPASAAQLASALERLLTSPTLRETLGAKGRELARRFTWKNSAERSAEFFTRVGS